MNGILNLHHARVMALREPVSSVTLLRGVEEGSVSEQVAASSISSHIQAGVETCA